MPDFMRLTTSLAIGQEVTALVLRDGKETPFRLRPVERGELHLKEQELKPWGLTVRDLSFLAAKEMKRPSQAGVLVTSVRPGGPAGEAKPPLDAKDVLVEVNGTPVQNTAALLGLTRALTEGKTEPTPVIATFERAARRYLTVVKVGLQELRDPGLEVAKAWLPVETHVISHEIAAQLHQPDLKGFYLTRVYPGSTAEKAGLQAGDFVRAVDGEKLTASGPEAAEELATLIRQYDVGAVVQLTVLRGQTELKIPVELARSPKLKREMKKYRNDDFEFSARDVSFFDVAEQQWPAAQRGALVEEVKSGSWAEVGSLETDDLIVEIEAQPVQDVNSLKQLMDQAARDKKPFLALKVLRGIHTAYLELEPAWKK
jgi:serine protease Do